MDVVSYKCPNCAAPLTFDNENQNMHCAACGQHFDMSTLQDETPPSQEWETYDEHSGSGDWNEEEISRMAMQVCPSCGGEIVCDQNTAATKCPYCDNPTILTKQLTGMFKPDFVIPFQVDKKTAKEALKQLCKGKWLLPKMFTDENRMESITGIYIPFWLYSCDTQATITYGATNVSTWSDNDYIYTKTDQYMLTREGSLRFEQVPVDGSTKMEDAFMEAIEPFDYAKAVDFQTAYLSGYLADKYDVDAAQSNERANERITNSTKQIFASTVSGYSSFSERAARMDFLKNSVRYALLPVWMLNTRYKGKTYQFAMNGQTGKLVGALPLDKGKYWAWFGGIFAGLTLIGHLIAFAMGVFR